MKTPCSHCHQEYDTDSLMCVSQNGTTLYFCCNGCKFVYELLQDKNLQSFYDKLGDKSLHTKERFSKQNSFNFSSINFLEKYLKPHGEYKEVHFMLEGIVCAACVWLNEKILRGLEGIIDVQINYTSYKVKLVFDDRIISLSSIVESIRNIGYDVIVFDSKKDSTYNKTNYYIKIVVAIFCTMNVMWVNVGQYSGHFFGIDSIESNILNLASFLLATPVLFFCASEFYIRAYKGLKSGIIGMETLVISGTTLVYAYSIYAWLSGSGHTYFESVCMIILFVYSAKFLELLSKKKANDNLLKLNAILPLEARLISGEIVSVYDVKVDSKILVLPGEIVAFDGFVESNATLDYSNISGESMPVSKRAGDEISAGSIVLHSPLILRVCREFEDSSMSKLSKMLNDSAFSSPKIATFAFRIAGIFSKVVLSIAALGFLCHYFLLDSGFEMSLLICVSVIVIACPCALALATPIASVVGLNVGFKHKIIFTKTSFLESLAKSDYIVFDKTGTLTSGNMSVERTLSMGGSGIFSGDLSKDSFVIASIMRLNPHRIATSILEYLEQEQADSNISSFSLIEGRGFEAQIEEHVVIGGSESFMKERGLRIDDEDCLHTKFYLACDDRIVYIFYLSDTLKKGAEELVNTLRDMKKEICIASGDRERSVRHIADSLRIKEYYHSLRPLQKADRISSLINSGKNVVMIGDGLNDSLALKYAQVGISMGSGSEISLAHSDVVILDDGLDTLRESFIISKRTFGIIKQNLILSLIYNSLAIPAALCGYVIPLFAAIFMSISSLCVVLNSLRIYLK